MLWERLQKYIWLPSLQQAWNNYRLMLLPLMPISCQMASMHALHFLVHLNICFEIVWSGKRSVPETLSRIAFHSRPVYIKGGLANRFSVSVQQDTRNEGVLCCSVLVLHCTILVFFFSVCPLPLIARRDLRCIQLFVSGFMARNCV